MKLSQDISAIITGGGSGLGKATAQRLASFGIKVAIFDLNVEAGTEVAKNLGGVFCEVDVSSYESLSSGFEKARKAHGQERILICCAGIAPGQKTVSKGLPHDPELFAKTTSINLNGTFYSGSLAATGMVKTSPISDDGARGVIIMTASVAGMEGQVGQAAYGASKAGVIGLTLPMARDLSRDGIRVVTIAPGIFETPMLKGLPQDVQDALGKQIPFPSRLAKPDEYAMLAQQICENDMINGSVHRLDGAIRLSPK
ncbi:3-hydroxyacyl-CoA dehydrogenase [Hyphomicrobiales bacterium 4NK60-0047b]|jgi:NAD(P)-dependent dehydrogenase (short-subunit alcohol dehydrogenase family)